MSAERIPKLSALQDAVIYKLYLAAAGTGRGELSLRAIRGLFQISIGETFLQNAIYRAAEDELLVLLQYSDPTHWQITAKGIAHVETELDKAGSVIAQVADQGDVWLLSDDSIAVGKKKDAWKEADELGLKSEEALIEIKGLLREILERLNSSDLDQSDKAQASAPVTASSAIVEMPAPKLGLVKRMIKPLGEIASIAELVKRLLALLS